MNYRVIDRQEDFTWFLQAVGLAVSENTLDKLLKLIRTYHRPYLKHISSVDDIPDPARKDPRLSSYRPRVKAAHIDKSKAESNMLRAWAFNPQSAGLEELIVEQYQDWPLTTDSKRHESDLKAPAAEPASQKPSEPASQKPSSQKPTEPASQKPSANNTPNTPANTGSAPNNSGTPQTGGKSNIGLIVVVILVIVAAILFFVLK